MKAEMHSSYLFKNWKKSAITEKITEMTEGRKQDANSEDSRAKI